MHALIKLNEGACCYALTALVLTKVPNLASTNEL